MVKKEEDVKMEFVHTLFQKTKLRDEKDGQRCTHGPGQGDV